MVRYYTIDGTVSGPIGDYLRTPFQVPIGDYRGHCFMVRYEIIEHAVSVSDRRLSRTLI